MNKQVTAGWDAYIIDVPGNFNHEVTYLDLETRKVPTEPRYRKHSTLSGSFIMQNGERLRNRWQAFLAGVSSFRRITIVENVGDEVMFLEGVREAIWSNVIVYAATREFDEMILKGRFTNARRAHEPKPFFPALPDAESLGWRNLGKFPRVIRADDDLPSKGISREYMRGQYELVLVHNLRDVVELIVFDGKPDQECRRWCGRVLSDTEFARDQIFGGE